MVSDPKMTLTLRFGSEAALDDRDGWSGKHPAGSTLASPSEPTPRQSSAFPKAHSQISINAQ
jgi:hypothetical protein